MQSLSQDVVRQVIGCLDALDWTNLSHCNKHMLQKILSLNICQMTTTRVLKKPCRPKITCFFFGGDLLDLELLPKTLRVLDLQRSVWRLGQNIFNSIHKFESLEFLCAPDDCVLAYSHYKILPRSLLSLKAVLALPNYAVTPEIVSTLPPKMTSLDLIRCCWELPCYATLPQTLLRLHLYHITAPLNDKDLASLPPNLTDLLLHGTPRFSQMAFEHMPTGLTRLLILMLPTEIGAGATRRLNPEMDTLTTNFATFMSDAVPFLPRHLHTLVIRPIHLSADTIQALPPNLKRLELHGECTANSAHFCLYPASLTALVFKCHVFFDNFAHSRFLSNLFWLEIARTDRILPPNVWSSVLPKSLTSLTLPRSWHMEHHEMETLFPRSITHLEVGNIVKKRF